MRRSNQRDKFLYEAYTSKTELLGAVTELLGAVMFEDQSKSGATPVMFG